MMQLKVCHRHWMRHPQTDWQHDALGGALSGFQIGVPYSLKGHRVDPKMPWYVHPGHGNGASTAQRTWTELRHHLLHLGEGHLSCWLSLCLPSLHRLYLSLSLFPLSLPRRLGFVSWRPALTNHPGIGTPMPVLASSTNEASRTCASALMQGRAERQLPRRSPS